MRKWIPGRKVAASGLGAVVAWLLIQALDRFTGVQISLEEATGIVGAVTVVCAACIPDSAKDVLEKADKIVRKIGDNGRDKG